MIESLEQRSLMAVVAGQSSAPLVSMQLSNGTLTINGSSYNENLYIRDFGSSLYVTAFNSIMTWSPSSRSPVISGDVTRDFPLSSINKVVVNLKGGNDKLHQELPVGQTIVYAGAGNDLITGRFGSARKSAALFGEGGNDTVKVGGQFCRADGGAGADSFQNFAGSGFGPMVDYSTRTANVTADMDNVADDGEAGEGDNIEPSCFGIIGGSGNDYLAGAFSVAGTSTGGEGMFYGNDGNDTIFGGTGFDAIFGGIGDDQLHGGPVSDGPNIGDHIQGEDGNDTIWGTGSMSDSLNGGPGADVIHPTE